MQFVTGGGGGGGDERYEDIIIVHHVTTRLGLSVIPQRNLLTPTASHAGAGGPGLGWDRVEHCTDPRSGLRFIVLLRPLRELA